MANFYHSFPRKDCSIDMGLAILESILEMGFLLTPEVSKWHSVGTDEPTTSAFATRMCFTLLEESELTEHSKVFGDFALELKPESLIALGGLPAIYLPNKQESEKGVSGLGAAYINKLAKLDLLLRSLGQLEHLINHEVDPKRKLKFKDFRTNDEEEINCSVENAAALLKYLTTQIDIPNIHSLVQAQMSFSELVYQAGDDSRYNVGELGYYQQREWKICSRITCYGEHLTDKLTTKEQLRLGEINSKFFQKNLEFAGTSATIAESSTLYSEIDGRKVISYINRILVPESAREKTEELLLKHNLKIEIGTTPPIKNITFP